MPSSRIEFDWDPVKAASNIVKHGVSFMEALEVFADPLALSTLDHGTAANEERWVTIGRTGSDLLVVVVHSHSELEETGVRFRLISAPKATKRERVQYENDPDFG